MDKTSKAGKVLIYAILLIFTFVIIAPILYVFFASLKSNMELLVSNANFLPKNPTFDNYKEIFKSETFDFVRMFFNSVYYTVCCVAITVVSSSFLAYIFERGEFPLKKMWFAIFSALMFVNFGGITVYPTFEALKWFGLSSSLNGLIITKLFGINIVNMYLVRSYIRTLPKELDEAAEIDGCSFLRIFFAVIMPLLKPIIATIAILAFNGSWNDYLLPTVYTVTRPEQRTLVVGLMEMKNSGGGVTSWNVLFAGTVLSLVPVLIAYTFGNKFFVEGLSEGAVKG